MLYMTLALIVGFGRYIYEGTESIRANEVRTIVFRFITTRRFIPFFGIFHHANLYRRMKINIFALTT